MRLDFATVWHYLKRNRLAMAAVLFVLLLLVLVAIGPHIGPYDPQQANPADALQPPSLRHLFGTDASGLDIFSRVIAAPRVDLTIALLAATVSLIVGSALGAVSGYYRGIGSEIIARVADLGQSFPLFVLAMALVAAVGQSPLNIVVVLGVLYAPMFIRLVRSRTYAVRESLFIEATRTIGASDRRIVLRHLLPNSLPPALIQYSVNIGFAILFTAGLSFVGAGVRPPTPEWGLMIATGAPDIVTGQWWPALFPGLAIGLAVMAFAIVGDMFEHLLDPRRR